MTLFESSFADIYRFAIQNLVFKMEMLEAFIIRQVGIYIIKSNIWYCHRIDAK